MSKSKSKKMYDWLRKQGIREPRRILREIVAFYGCRLATGLMRFYDFCMVFPLGMAAVFAIVYIDGGWADLLEGHAPEYYMLPELKHPWIAVILLVCLCMACAKVIRVMSGISAGCRKRKSVTIVSGIVIFVIAAVARLLFMYLFQEDIRPFSDFNRTWCMAHGEMEGNIEYYSLFPAYLNFTVFLKKLIAVFGDTYMHLIYFNAVLAALTASLLYFITRMITCSEKTALSAGLLYACMPSNIIYCATGTPEFLAIACQVLGVLFFVRAMKAGTGKKAVWMFFGGILEGIGSSYKSFGIIIVIAFGMILAAKGLAGVDHESFGGKKAYLLTAMYVVLVFSGYSLAERAVIHHTEEVLQISVNTKAPYPHYFLIGLNTQGEGQIHMGNISRTYYMKYLSNGQDADAARKYALEVLKEDWQQNKKAVLPHFIKKMIWAWQDDNIPLFYFCTSVGLHPDTYAEWAAYRFMNSYMGSVEQFYYTGLLLLALMGYILHNREKERCFEMEFLKLIIFGYFCLMLLSEAQSRYKCLILPYICIAASVGIRNMVNKRRAPVIQNIFREWLCNEEQRYES